jgi:hypothetical protein
LNRVRHHKVKRRNGQGRVDRIRNVQKKLVSFTGGGGPAIAPFPVELGKSPGLNRRAGGSH